MVNVGDYVKCPVCGGKARVVFVSRNSGRCMIKCPQSHVYGLRNVKGLCFLVDCSKVEIIMPKSKRRRRRGSQSRKS